MRDYADLDNEPGIWEEDEKKFWNDLRKAAESRSVNVIRKIILTAVRQRIPRYEAINIIIPVWERFFEDAEELFREIYDSLKRGPSPGLLRLMAEIWPERIDENILAPRNVREFLNYDGAESIEILYSLLPKTMGKKYLELVKRLFLDNQLGYQDSVVQFLLDREVISNDEVLIALSKQDMNWPTQHLYVKLIKISSLDKQRLREISERVLLKELTTITEPLLDQLEYDDLAASRIVRDSFIKHASYFELEEAFSIASKRCTQEDMEKIKKAPNYVELVEKKKAEPIYRENLAEKDEEFVTQKITHTEDATSKKDFFLSHAMEDKNDFVIPLAKELEDRGMTVWIDNAEVKWGDNLYDKVSKGIKDSNYVITFLSESFIRKKWPKRELYMALNIEDQSGTKKVLPLMLTSPDVILSEYPLIAEKVYMQFNEGVKNIANRCQELVKGTTKIVNVTNYPIEDREEMLRSGYSKKESFTRKYATKLIGNRVVIRTDIPEGTKVLAEISQVQLEKLAVDIGSRSAVLDALEQTMPDKKDKISGDERVMKALMNFAAAFGGRDSLKKYRQRIPVMIGKDGLLEISDIKESIPGSDIEVILTIMQ